MIVIRDLTRSNFAVLDTFRAGTPIFLDNLIKLNARTPCSLGKFSLCDSYFQTSSENSGYDKRKKINKKKL